MFPTVQKALSGGLQPCSMIVVKYLTLAYFNESENASSECQKMCYSTKRMVEGAICDACLIREAVENGISKPLGPGKIECGSHLR